MGKNRVSVKEKNHVLIIEINRPEKRNAFDIEMYRELSIAYGELHRNPGLRCGLLIARGVSSGTRAGVGRAWGSGNQSP